MAVNNEAAFFLALLLIIMGNGLFKPNISALVGKIYESDPKYRNMKDSGYNIFYMGIIVGAFVCNFIAATCVSTTDGDGRLMLPELVC